MAATVQLVQDPAGSSVAAVVAAVAAAAAERAACGGPGEEPTVVVGPDVMGLAEPGTEQEAGEELAWFERKVEIVPGQTAEECSVLVVAAAAADEPAPGATARTAGADGFAGTAADIIVLGSRVL